MKKIILTLLFLTSLSFNVFSENDIWKIKNMADCEVTYQTHLKKLDIGIGTKKNGLWYREEFSLDELKEYFIKQKHKDLIVVTISKNMLPKKELNTLVNSLHLYFKEAGYKQIVITQASSGIGWPILLNKKNNL